MAEQNIIVSSEDSKNYFPQNNPAHFTSLFSKPIELHGKWIISLKALSFELETSANGEAVIFDIHLTQTSGTILYGNESMLLSRIYTYLTPGQKVQIMNFDILDSSPIRLESLDKVEIIITPVLPVNFSFNPSSVTYATLVLKQE